MRRMDEIDHYLSNVTAGQRAEFARIRRIVHATVPDVEEVFSYRMPGFRANGRPLIWVGAFKHHMSIFPGTIRFTDAEPLPDERIEEILRENLARTSPSSPSL
jgi:uncharacterized protein YdhG (YjbR/CyaY superfamily)